MSAGRSLAPVITIDGPTASGKGTVAAGVARVLRWHLLDSGALYRLVALASLQRGLRNDDGDAIAAAVSMLDIRFDAAEIWLADACVTQAIRQESVGIRASEIAALPEVRAALLARQRAFRQRPGLVADGRDMGTVVFPDAQFKIFLTADPYARALRRYRQLQQNHISADVDVLWRDLMARDARDMQRVVAPLCAAADAVTLDTSKMEAAETIHVVLELYRQRTWEGA